MRLTASSTCGLIAATVLTACASGPKFAGIERPATGRSVLYLYRSAALPQGVNTFTTLVEPGINPIVDLKNGSWSRVELDPGRYEISAHGQVMPMVCSGASIDVEAGRVMFVRLKVTMRGDGYRNYQSCALARVGDADALAAMEGLARVP
jgi:hypothetical protein